MAVWIKWSDEQKAVWDMWLKERPPAIQAMAALYDLRADKLYRHKTTGQRFVLVSFSEDETVTVGLYRHFNKLPFAEVQERQVFGVNPADLEECDYPTEEDVWPGHWIPVRDGAKGESLE